MAVVLLLVLLPAVMLLFIVMAPWAGLGAGGDAEDPDTPAPLWRRVMPSGPSRSQTAARQSLTAERSEWARQDRNLHQWRTSQERRWAASGGDGHTSGRAAAERAQWARDDAGEKRYREARAAELLARCGY